MKMLRSQGAGYTIVESMVFLAVTGALFFSVVAIINSQQGKTEFTQAVRDLETKLVDVANDVYQGYYPQDDTSPDCRVMPAGIQFNPGSNIQGSSTDCVFAGKAVEFNPAAGENQIRVFTLATRRLARNGLPVSSLGDLEDGDIAITEKGAGPGMFALDELLTLQHGLRIRSVNDGATTPSTIAFLSGFARRAASGSSYTGSPETDLYTLTTTTAGQSDPDLRSRLQTVSNYQPIDADGVEICVEHSAGGRRALLTLGREQRKLTVTTEIDAIC